MGVLHLVVDDYSRLAYSQVLPDEIRLPCLIFLKMPYTSSALME